MNKLKFVGLGMLNMKSKDREKCKWWCKETINLKSVLRQCEKKPKPPLKSDWELAKKAKRNYNIMLRRKKRDSMKSFCSNIHSVSELSRIKKLLSTEPKVQLSDIS